MKKSTDKITMQDATRPPVNEAKAFIMARANLREGKPLQVKEDGLLAFHRVDASVQFEAFVGTLREGDTLYSLVVFKQSGAGNGWAVLLVSPDDFELGLYEVAKLDKRSKQGAARNQEVDKIKDMERLGIIDTVTAQRRISEIKPVVSNRTPLFTGALTPMETVATRTISIWLKETKNGNLMLSGSVKVTLEQSDIALLGEAAHANNDITAELDNILGDMEKERMAWYADTASASPDSTTNYRLDEQKKDYDPLDNAVSLSDVYNV